jgi:preprotein translocase subunit SecF
MRLLQDTNIDFIGKRKTAFIISVILILAGVISLIIQGGPRYGIDFTGGILLELDFTPSDPAMEPIDIENIRSVLATQGFGDVEIQDFGNPNYILARFKPEEDAEEESAALLEILHTEFPEYAGNKSPSDFERRREHVGAKIGAELQTKAITAILIALLGIIIYIWWRFELIFGVSAVITLFHDVIITIGLFSIFGREINLPVIGAILAIIGYSLNDTIVIFVRIREDLKAYRREKYESVVNHSINETLSRTVVTSLTTLVVVLCLFIFGGAAINDFAFAFLCGIIIGTYSSIFVASSLLVTVKNRRVQKAAASTNRKLR